MSEAQGDAVLTALCAVFLVHTYVAIEDIKRSIYETQYTRLVDRDVDESLRLRFQCRVTLWPAPRTFPILITLKDV